jgi:hypothetical protein
VLLEHGYEAWENKDKFQNNDQKDSDHGDNNCIGDYHEDNNTTDKYDRDHDDSKPSNHKCVSCHSYHLRAVVLTMSKSMVATMLPMMGGHEENTTKARHIVTMILATRAARISSIDKEDNNKYSP